MGYAGQNNQSPQHCLDRIRFCRLLYEIRSVVDWDFCMCVMHGSYTANALAYLLQGSPHKNIAVTKHDPTKRSHIDCSLVKL